jgi:hypothetical protein
MSFPTPAYFASSGGGGAGAAALGLRSRCIHPVIFAVSAFYTVPPNAPPNAPKFDEEGETTDAIHTIVVGHCGTHLKQNLEAVGRLIHALRARIAVKYARLRCLRVR